MVAQRLVKYLSVMLNPFWYPTELSYMKALGKVVAVNPWKVWEECTARRKRATTARQSRGKVLVQAKLAYRRGFIV